MIELTRDEALLLYYAATSYVVIKDKECIKKRCTHDINLISQAREIDKELEPIREITQKLLLNIIDSAAK